MNQTRCSTRGTSLVVQWLRLHASTTGGMGLIPGWGTKIPHAMQCGKKKKVQQELKIVKKNKKKFWS